MMAEQQQQLQLQNIQQHQQYLQETLPFPSGPASSVMSFLEMPQQYNMLQNDPNPSATDHLMVLDADDANSGFEYNGELDLFPHWNNIDSGIDIGSTPATTSLCSTSGATSSSTRATSEENANILPQDQQPQERPHILAQQQPHPQVHDCEAKAFSTLHSLHYCTMMHSERPAAQVEGLPRFSQISMRMPSLDKVLVFNRVAVCELKELLECPCAEQPHLSLLYMTIILKTLFWYRLAVNPQYDNMAPEEATSGSSGGQCKRQQNGSSVGVLTNLTGHNVKAKTIQIGVFDLEEEDEKLLMRSVLVREVKKVESVVVLMKEMTSRQAQEDYGDDEGNMQSWYAIGGAKLEREVRDTLKMIKEMSVKNPTSS